MLHATTRNSARWLGWMTLGALIAATMSVAWSPRATQAVPGTAYVYHGMDPEPQWCWNWSQFPPNPPNSVCWHDDEAGTYTAVDFNWGSGNDDAGALVQLWYTGGRQYINFVGGYTGAKCKMVRAIVYSDAAKTIARGDLRYLHIDPYGGVIGTGYDYNGYDHYYRDLGSVAYGENSDCSWDGAHVHQSADTSGSSAIYTNWTGNPTSSWVHRICFSGC